MAYKADVHDTRESPSLEVMRLLVARGGDVVYCDPWVPEIELDGAPRERALVGRGGRARGLRRHAHAAPQFLDDPLWDGAGRIVDTRNVVPAGPNVHRI